VLGCTGATLSTATRCDGAGTCAGCVATSSCGTYTCNAAMTSCLTSCSTDAQCAPGDYCTGGACVPQKAPGQACTAAGECQGGGACGGGICCGATCVDQGAGSCGTDGTCASGTGACQMYPAASACFAATTCTGVMATAFLQCDGLGACNLGTATVPCPGGYVCDAPMTGCLTACGTSDADCDASFYCDGVGAGACRAKKPAGATCALDHECQNGTCTASNDCN
jgi:hypothetical protein